MLRNRLMEGVLATIPNARVNGPVDPELRLPNNLNVIIPGVEGETLLLSLDMLGIAASAGSACTTGNTEPSHVLKAMGLSDELCRSAMRFTVGRSNNIEQIDTVVARLTESVGRARGFAGVAG
jgi:cysteine desulfurase